MKINDTFNMFKRNRTGVIGGVIGALLAVLILAFGFLRVLFIVVCAVVGCVIGTLMQSSKSWIKKLIDKIFPPGTYR